MNSMAKFPDQLIGVVCLNHKYAYNTKMGIEHTNRPELIQHKYCNILFELNTHNVSEPEQLRDIMNTVLYSEKDKSIITDISTFESILMTLNEASIFPINKKDPYIVSDDPKTDQASQLKFNYKHDAIAPFRKMILNNILADRDNFLDYERSIPLSGPIFNITKILAPKCLGATNENYSFLNEVTNDKYLSALHMGPTSKRVFYTDSKKKNVFLSMIISMNQKNFFWL